MAQQIVFTRDPESSGGMSHIKLSKVCLPFHVIRKHQEQDRKLGIFRPGLDYEELLVRRAAPLIHWISKLVSDVERDVKFPDVKNLSWEFAYYIYIHEGDAGDEFAFRCSAPLWFITVRDPSGENIHKNWSIAIDDDGELNLKRGKATSENSIADGYYIHDNCYGRLCDIVRTHMQMVDWAKNKNKTS